MSLIDPLAAEAASPVGILKLLYEFTCDGVGHGYAGSGELNLVAVQCDKVQLLHVLDRWIEFFAGVNSCTLAAPFQIQSGFQSQHQHGQLAGALQGG